MANEQELDSAVKLIRSGRWAAFATAEMNTPYVSAVAYAYQQDLSCLVLHLSRLASHTGRLSKNPHVALLISEGDDGRDDPQTLARLSITGLIEHVPREHGQHPSYRGIYLQRLPEAEPRFSFSDFELFRFVPGEIRFVGGFARARTFTGERLHHAAMGSA
ncbi:MAG: CREG family protein [Alphaproteobacteria bacterium]|nr:CREG family protein [Alphaproteobacteria bacterium]MDH5534688.1 CREG family protein [Betaproteobacteria bacterium]